MPRFHCPFPLSTGSTVDLPDGVVHHLHVLRMQPGDALTLFDGRGGQYAATLAEIGKRRASALVAAHAAVAALAPHVGPPAIVVVSRAAGRSTQIARALGGSPRASIDDRARGRRKGTG